MDTLIDTWDWMQTIPGGWQPSDRTPGLAADKEAELLGTGLSGREPRRRL